MVSLALHRQVVQLGAFAACSPCHDQHRQFALQRCFGTGGLMMLGFTVTLQGSRRNLSVTIFCCFEGFGT